MRKTLTILSNSLRLTMQELMVNKLRTALSLIGISFGIFCIIGVLATVNSLEENIQNQIKSLGSNTIYIDKWEYFHNGADYPWWKFIKRPVPKFEEVALIKQRSRLAKHVAFLINDMTNVEYQGQALTGVMILGVSEEENDIQPISTVYGRYLSSADFAYGNPVAIIGYKNAEDLFGDASFAVGKKVKIKDVNVTIVGVIKKMGTSMVGLDYDQCVMTNYRFAKQIFNEDNSHPRIIVSADDKVSSAALANDLEGVMRSIRKLNPKEEDNFSANQIIGASERVSSLFGSINIGGWAIGILSLIVGAFGIANIMFVTVKERTAIIGLKKAIGAKRRSILSEFLLEAAIICLLGGLIGLLLVYILTLILTSLFSFPVFISVGILVLAISICIIIGILAGIIPAYSASRLDPVVAIRSK
ncbi:MAG TPA: ABC transporter permease [Chitinophagaceae bacterium]|nr:ABC transporter permease [Chitinophagaceae bacterium]